MAKKKKKKFYVVYSAEFQGIVESLKEYNQYIVNKKAVHGKGFTSKEAAQAYLSTLKKQKGPQQKHGIYAIYGPLFTGIVHNKQEFVKLVVGQKKMHGKLVKTVEEGEAWILKHNKVKAETKVKAEASASVITQEKMPKPNINQTSTDSPVKHTPTPNTMLQLEQNLLQQCVLYIDGGFKDGVGKYGVLAYVSSWEQPILRDFGHVYDEAFNEITNTGAELMACLRGLEWAYANGLHKIVIVYDCEGIIRLQNSMSNQPAVQLFTKMMTRFQQVMDIQFIHVRHSNRELHNAVHELTQLAL